MTGKRIEILSMIKHLRALSVAHATLIRQVAKDIAQFKKYGAS
jgi:hypothetical protein